MAFCSLFNVIDRLMMFKGVRSAARIYFPIVVDNAAQILNFYKLNKT